MEIEEPPNRPTFCSQCMGSITWLYSPRRRRWLPFVGATALDRRQIRLCEHDQADVPHWKRVEPQPAEVLQAGARRARAVLVAKNITEKEHTPDA